MLSSNSDGRTVPPPHHPQRIDLRRLQAPDAAYRLEHRAMVAGRRDGRAAARQGHEAEPIARRQVVDESLEPIERGAAVAQTHVRAIDDQEDDAGGLGDVVAAHVWQPLVGGRIRSSHGNQLERIDRARLAVDGESEVVGGEAGDRTPVFVDDDGIDCDEVDTRAEHGLLRVPDQGHGKEADGEGEHPHGDQRRHSTTGRRPGPDNWPVIEPHRYDSLDLRRSDNWIYGFPDRLFCRNPNAVPTSASGMKPAISRLVTDSLRFVISRQAIRRRAASRWFRASGDPVGR
jgi:hypothetical protein